MRVRLLTLLAGPGGVKSPGSVLDLGEAEALEMIAGGFAAPMDPSPPAAVETAEAAGAPERAVLERGRSGKKRGADGP